MLHISKQIKMLYNKFTDWYKSLTRNKKLTLKISGVFLAIIIILTISAVAILNSRLMQQNPVQDGENSLTNSTEILSQQSTDDTIKDKSVNFLVVGLDESESLTDVIMIVNYDIAENKISILQVPRDSYIGEDYITGKINSVYGHAPVGQTKIGALIQVINEQFKIPIDYYATITLEGFRNAIDEIGGVEIDLPQAIYYLPEKTLQPGLQVLDGEKAEWFIRYRAGYISGDIGRMEAQTLFLKALTDKIANISISRATSLARNLFKEVTTDLSLKEILAFTNLVLDVDFDSMYTAIVPGEGIMYNGYAVYAIEKEELADILNEHFRPYSAKINVDDLEIEEIEIPVYVSSDVPSSQNQESASSENGSPEQYSSTDENINNSEDTEMSSEQENNTSDTSSQEDEDSEDEDSSSKNDEN